MGNVDHDRSGGDWEVRQADPDGAAFASDTERPFVPKAGSWSAKWIWLSSSAFPGLQEAYILPGYEWSYLSRRMQGFEYLQIMVTFPGGTHCKTPLKISAIEAVSTSFPVKYCGHFECSDPFLNRLWDVGRWTNQLCMQAESTIERDSLSLCEKGTL